MRFALGRVCRFLSCGVLTVAAFYFGSVSAFADSVGTKTRTVTQLAEGVYEIRHPDAPDSFPQGNTTVIIGSESVLVVDSCYLPSTAREDIAQIRQWTKKPVRYLLNTHWHYDHTMGNSEYVDAFPGLIVIAHTETRNQIAGYNPQWFEKYPTRAQRFQKVLDSGKNTDGTPLKQADIDDYKTAIAGVAPVQAEFSKISGRLRDLTPTITFSQEMDIQLGGREVQLKHVGRGNTAGDAIAYLPVEKILVTGDLVDAPVPYLFSGFPYDHVETLEKLYLMDTAIIVPGHGDVMRDKTYLKKELDFVRLISNEVKKAVNKLGPGPDKLDAIKEEVKKNVDVEALRKQFGGDSADDQAFFDTTLDGLIRTSYNATNGK